MFETEQPPNLQSETWGMRLMLDRSQGLVNEHHIALPILLLKQRATEQKETIGLSGCFIELT